MGPPRTPGVERTLAAPDAFAALCRRHGAEVHAYLSRRVGRQGADDLFNEVWTRAYAARATYDSRLGRELPWLYGIARNVLRAHWRTLQRPEAVPEPAAFDFFAEADDRLDAARQVEQLRTALLRLSDEERDVLFLVAWERLTPVEVAHALGIPAGTARSRLHRARHAVQGELTALTSLTANAPEENHA